MSEGLPFPPWWLDAFQWEAVEFNRQPYAIVREEGGWRVYCVKDSYGLHMPPVEPWSLVGFDSFEDARQALFSRGPPLDPPKQDAYDILTED